MSITNIAIFVFILIISLILACAFYYLYSSQPRAIKKEVMNEVLSNIMNFVIFVWASKILLNIRLFSDDPMAVIIYPSTAESFYIAFVLTAILFLVQIRKKKVDLNVFFGAFTFIFLVGSITNELIQYFWQNNLSSIGYLILLILVLTVFLLLEEKIKFPTLIYIVVVIYCVGLFILTFIEPIVTVFGYIIHPYFIGIFMVFSLLVTYITHNQKIRTRRNH